MRVARELRGEQQGFGIVGTEPQRLVRRRQRLRLLAAAKAQAADVGPQRGVLLQPARKRAVERLPRGGEVALLHP